MCYLTSQEFEDSYFVLREAPAHLDTPQIQEDPKVKTFSFKTHWALLSTHVCLCHS
jgi:hypothetical protein